MFSLLLLLFAVSLTLLVAEAASNRWCDVVVVRADAGRRNRGTCSCTVDISCWLQTVFCRCYISSLPDNRLFRAGYKWTTCTLLSVVAVTKYFGKCLCHL